MILQEQRSHWDISQCDRCYFYPLEDEWTMVYELLPLSAPPSGGAHFRNALTGHSHPLLPLHPNLRCQRGWLRSPLHWLLHQGRSREGHPPRHPAGRHPLPSERLLRDLPQALVLRQKKFLQQARTPHWTPPLPQSPSGHHSPSGHYGIHPCLC